MNNLIRERKGMLILSLLVILLPLGVGLFLWNQLPDQVPIHFGLNGQADNYAGKAFVVFGLPLPVSYTHLKGGFMHRGVPPFVIVIRVCRRIGTYSAKSFFISTGAPAG